MIASELQLSCALLGKQWHGRITSQLVVAYGRHLFVLLRDNRMDRSSIDASNYEINFDL